MNRRALFKSLIALPFGVFSAKPATAMGYGDIEFWRPVERIWVDAELVWTSDWDHNELIKFYRSIKGRGEGFRIKGYPA